MVFDGTIDLRVRYRMAAIGLLLALNTALGAGEPAWSTAVLDTARDITWLTDVEKDIVFELNKVRSDPSRYARDYLSPMRKHFQGSVYAAPGQVRMMTNEGVRALDECIRELERQRPLPIFSASQGLSRAAQDHVEDTGPRGITGHTGSDRSDMRSRIERYVVWDILIGENIAYGQAGARDIVIQLMVDDGVSSRGHRRNILSDAFRHVGVSVGPHREYGTMCVMDFAGDVRERGRSSP